MKITLKNFRCHKDSSFEIPDEGLILLSGESGSGKTTVLNGIAHALYGNIRKPYFHGSNTCQVILEYHGTIITRTNRPNKLVVSHKNKEYEDEAAQGLICDIFGMNFQEFVSSSYVVQSRHNSVISMTPTEQLKFVEVIAFSGGEHIEYREIFKEKVKECKLKVVRIEGELCTLEKHFDSKTENLVEVSQPKTRLSLKEAHIKQKELDCLLKKYKSDFSNLKIELGNVQLVESKNSEYDEKEKRLEIEISQFEDLISNIGKIKTQKDINSLKKELEDLEKLLQQTRSYNNYKKCIEKGKKFKKEHLDDLLSRADKLKSNLPDQKTLDDIHSEIEDLNSKREIFEKETREFEVAKESIVQTNVKIRKLFSEAKKVFPGKMSKIKKGKALLVFLNLNNKQLIDQLTKVEKNIEDLKDKISKQQICGSSYLCPSCNSSLYFDNEELCILANDHTLDVEEDYKSPLESEKLLADEISTKLESLKFWIKDLSGYLEFISQQRKVPKVSVVYDADRISDLEKESLRYQKIESDVYVLGKEISGGILPPSIISMFNDAKRYLKGFPKEFSIKISEEDILDDLSIIDGHISEYTQKIKEHASLSVQMKNRKSEMMSIKKKRSVKSERTSQIINEEMNKISDEILNSSSTISKLQKISEVLIKYESYQKELKEIEALEEELKIVRSKLKNAELKLQGAIGLEESAIEAEILSVNETISSVNEYAKDYLDELFEEQICVRLENQKIGVKGAIKTQMNTFIEYKGNEYKNIDEMSGGEQQRCELAFILAVNDMIGSKFILLDECLNNLDAEINMDVLTHLQEVGSKKLILVVSHEAVKGVFDKVISL